MSAKVARVKPSQEQIEAARKAAAEKVAAAEKARAEQVVKDQAWLDEKTKDMSEADKDELFQQISKHCDGAQEKDGRITTTCPLPHKLEYCVNADPFDCPNGKVPGQKGCKLSDDTSKALRDDTTCIDGSFVSAEEGGSYRSPYVPWGPISGQGKDGDPVLTSGNRSGVTIGTGVDLGAVSDPDAYLARLEKAGVSKETRDKIKPLLGKKTAAACEALREAKEDGPLVFPQADIEAIDTDAMKSRVPELKKQFATQRNTRLKTLNAQVKKESAAKAPNAAKIAGWEKEIENMSEFGDLTCQQQSVLFSTMYHEGTIGKEHTRPFVQALLAGDDDAARAALVAKTKDASKLIQSRGKSELAYWDAGGGTP